MLKEFKDFIMTGNVIEFAVAVILAGAVSGVVNGFVSDVMMPVVGHFAGDVDFADMKYVLSAAEMSDAGEEVKPENAIRYGAWINTIINLIIVGFVLFMMTKAYNRMKKKKEEAPAEPPAPTKDQQLLEEIRDLLKK